MTKDVDIPKKKLDPDRELRDTQQEMMLELKLKTEELLKKLKALKNKDRVKFGNM